MHCNLGGHLPRSLLRSRKPRRMQTGALGSLVGKSHTDVALVLLPKREWFNGFVVFPYLIWFHHFSQVGCSVFALHAARIFSRCFFLSRRSLTTELIINQQAVQSYLFTSFEGSAAAGILNINGSGLLFHNRVHVSTGYDNLCTSSLIVPRCPSSCPSLSSR